MAKKGVRILFSGFLALVMLFVTSGINLYIHYCSCENSIITSLLVEQGCQSDQTASCHSGSCSLARVEEETDCGCKTELVSVKLNDAFLHQQAEVNQVQKPIPLHFPNFQLDPKNLVQDSEVELLSCGYNEKRPGLVTGRELVLFLQQPKIPSIS